MSNASYLDYRMPVANDLPMLETVARRGAEPRSSVRRARVGEVPIVPPLGAVANALSAALGTRVTRLPATPQAILEALSALDA